MSMTRQGQDGRKELWLAIGELRRIQSNLEEPLRSGVLQTGALALRSVIIELIITLIGAEAE